MNRAEVEKKTRQLYHQIHQEQGDDPKIFQRLTTLLSTDFLRFPPDFFHGKVCLDAGCGSNANATFNFLEMGAQKVYAFDVDESIFESVPRYLKKYDGKYELKISNVLDIDFSDNFFDYTHCSGVLHSTTDVFKGIEELLRVTKKSGILYFDLYGKGGLVRDVTTFLRERYLQDPEFATLIDHLNEQKLFDFFSWIVERMSAKNIKIADHVSPQLIKQMFDKDLALTIKDRIQTPIYIENSAEEVINFLKERGIKKVERLTKYPHFNNIRKFLAPLYEQYDHPYSKTFYGSGKIQLKVFKPED